MEYEINENSIKFNLKDQAIISSPANFLFSIGDIRGHHFHDKKIIKYSGTGKIAVGSQKECKIFCVKIKPSSVYKFAIHSFIAMSEGISIQQKDEYFLKNETTDYQYIWLGARGNFEKISLTKDDTIMVRKDLLLIYDCDIVSINHDNVIIKGPATFYIQTCWVESQSPFNFKNILETISDGRQLRNKIRGI